MSGAIRSLSGLCIVVAAALALMVAPAGAAATGVAAPGFRPVDPGPHGYFEYSLSPGTSQSGLVVIRNRSSSTSTYTLYPSDAITSPVTGVAYGESTTAGIGAAHWIHISPSEVTLAPGHSIAVRFGVTVPPQATAGQHVAALSAQSPNVVRHSSTSDDASVALSTNARVVVAVVVDVAGPAVYGATLGRPRVEVQQHRRQLIVLPMASTGDLLMKPVLSGTLRACAPNGSPVLVHFDRQLDTFVPHTAISYPWYLDHVLGVGCYSVNLALTHDHNVLARFEGDIHIGPAQAAVTTTSEWPTARLIAIDAAVLAIVFGLFFFVLLRRRRRGMPGSETGGR